MSGTEPVEEDDPQVGENSCPRCAGSGRLDGEPCPLCGGSGRVPEIVGDA
jgi:DnaJ-class molecular chaperone